MNNGQKTIDAARVIERISDLRHLCLQLARVGYAGGLHNRDLNDPLAVGNPPPPWTKNTTQRLKE